MNETSLLYDFSSVGIAVSLFVAIVFFNEACFRLGRLVQANTDDEVKALTGSAQASILGLLALLLGFTFSMSMQRYDNRSMALIDEANAIGTAVLRTEFLPLEAQEKVRQLFGEYVALRVALGKVDLTRTQDRVEYKKQIAQVQSRLWALGVAATNQDPRAVTTGSFMNALSAAIDQEGKRSAILQSHVPEPILLLLFFVFVAAIGIMGYSSGLTGRRVFAPLLLVSFLITLIVFIIIDLDRPKRGLITVNQGPMVELLDTLGGENTAR